MRVLFLHSSYPDYLSDGLFHGLRQKLGLNCVDAPGYDYMYEPLLPETRKKLRGNGFTLYGLLQDSGELKEARLSWRRQIEKYDCVIIANIWRQVDQYVELCSAINPRKLILLDGADASECFPYAFRLRSTPAAYLTSVRQSLYFKRELMDRGESFGLARYLPTTCGKWLGQPRNVLPISFSIPAEKISTISPLSKLKDFNRDVVDPELAETDRARNLSSVSYPFQHEAEYYADLQVSRFGITTKRAGWDCLRHYEIAANGAVLAFRNLDQKPRTCAPHGLNPNNSLSYRDRSDLVNQLSALSAERYVSLQAASHEWIKHNTTLRRAEEVLETFVNFHGNR